MSRLTLADNDTSLATTSRMLIYPPFIADKSMNGNLLVSESIKHQTKFPFYDCSSSYQEIIDEWQGLKIRIYSRQILTLDKSHILMEWEGNAFKQCD